jgi:acyl-CoA synthetase (AMP-forming)/AMP-acid ligase II/thioesterase domain-containing protein
MRTFSCAALRAIAQFAESAPLAPALIEPNGITLSYKELWDQIEAVNRRLRQAGIEPGQRVAVLLPQGMRQILAFLGALKEHSAIPVQSKTISSEVAAYLKRLSVAALITSEEFPEEIEAAFQSGVTVLMANKGDPPGAWPVHAGHATPKSITEAGNAILFLITSATTGNCKIVPLSALNLDAGNASTRDWGALTSNDRLLFMVALCHRLGVESALAQLLAGGAMIVTNGFDPSAFIHWLNDLRPTWYVSAPAVHQSILTLLKSKRPSSPHSLRLLQSAGAPLPSEVGQELETILGVPVLNGYGATEAHYIATQPIPPNDLPPQSAGRSCISKIGILSPAGDFLLPGEEGEIVARGAPVFPGYYDDPEATRLAFHQGWFRTGDLGHLDQDGNLYVTGRLKEMINRGGEKILPGEVDAAFASHPAVLEAAAFGVPHPTLGEDVACAVVLRKATEPQPSARELRRHAAQHLAPFKVPHRIHFVDEIPRGELGKPQRWMLTEQLSGRNSAPPTPAEIKEEIAANGIVIVLHEIWSRILSREDLGFDEDFFAAGGDSLAAINMLAEVDRRYDCQTSAFAASFIDEPTLENLGRLVGKPMPPIPSGGASSDMQILPVRSGSSGVHLFCFTPGAIEGLPFRRLAKHLQDEMDLSIVRPTNMWYSRSLFTFEINAAEALALIRRVQPQGPYFLCGYCLGGVVAIEAARQLLFDGQEARVIFVETLLPGYPSFFRDWRVWMAAVGRQLNRLWTSEHPGLIGNLRIFTRRFLWFAIAALRRFLVPIENFSTFRRILEWTQDDDYPVYKVHPVDAPCLHILSADEPNSLDAMGAAARFGWKSYARRGIEEQYVAFDHHNVFHELNMPKIAEALRGWCSAQSGGLKHPAKDRHRRIGTATATH